MKPCEYCGPERKEIPLATPASWTWIEGNRLHNAYDDCEIHNCPMCGRELEGTDENAADHTD